MADRIEAFGTVRTGIESSRARKTRSVWVVALGQGREHFRHSADEIALLPKGVTDDEEGDVFLMGVSQDLLTVGLDHAAVGDGDWPSIVAFLLSVSAKPLSGVRWGWGPFVWYQGGRVDKEDAGVCLEVDPGRPLDDLEALDRYVGLVGQPKTDEVQHLAGVQGSWKIRPTDQHAEAAGVGRAAAVLCDGTAGDLWRGKD